MKSSRPISSLTANPMQGIRLEGIPYNGPASLIFDLLMS